MFTRFTALKRPASGLTVSQFLTLSPKTALRNQFLLRSSAVSVARRFQSSSSSSKDNGNNNQDMSPLTSSEVPINASIELHRVDLAHGSFFALHRPLLGIANGPMFAQHTMLNEDDFEDPVDDLTNYFSTLHPYAPPPPLSQSTVVTPTATAWASMPQSMPDAEQAVEDFFRQVEDKQLSTETMEDPASSPSSSNGTTDSTILDPTSDETNTMHMTSVLRKRRIKMRKHKYKKLRKRTRALRKKLGK